VRLPAPQQGKKRTQRSVRFFVYWIYGKKESFDFAPFDEAQDKQGESESVDEEAIAATLIALLGMHVHCE